MTHRLLAGSLLGAVLAVGWQAATRPAAPAITAEPTEDVPRRIVFAAKPSPDAPVLAGITTIARTSTARPTSKAAPKEPAPPLDTVEPWTGEDLAPQLQALAIGRPRLEIERSDPWNPSTVYPYDRQFEDRPLDGADPWARRAAAPSVIAKALLDRRAPDETPPPTTSSL